MCATASCGVCACSLRMKVASAVSIRWRRKAIVCSRDSAARAGTALQIANKIKTQTNQRRTLLNRAPKRSCARPEWLEHSTYGLEIRCSIRLSYGRSCAAKLPPASVACKFCRAICNEIDHVCNRTCRDGAGHCLCLVAHGKSKRKRCSELVNGDCALQVRRLVGVR